MKKLAFYGGDPVIGEGFPTVNNNLGRFFGQEEIDMVTEVVKSGSFNYICNGKCIQFENEFAEKFNSRYAAACSSGTASLHGAIIALDLEPGDEVIVPPITDMGTIIPVLMQNLIPVFADVDPNTHCIDPASVAEKITRKTRAIIPVHMFGHPVDMDPIIELAKRHNLYVIEDCCQAFLTRYKNKLCGTIGDIGCFSFQQTKHLTTGDGGMIITSNDRLGSRIKLCVDKGWPRNGNFRDHLFLAPAYHMTEFQAAVGICQLRKLEMIVDLRIANGKKLDALVNTIPGLTAPQTYDYAKMTYWKYPIKVDMSKMSVDMDMVAKLISSEGLECWAGYTKVPIYMYNVLTAPYTYGKSGYPLVGGGYTYGAGLCPKAEKDLEALIVTPMCEGYQDKHINMIYDALNKVFSAIFQG